MDHLNPSDPAFSTPDFPPTHPLDLPACLRIRDGLTVEPQPRLSPRLIETLDRLSLRDPSLCLN